MGDLDAMYRKAAELLEGRAYADFSYLQKLMADRMDDEGSPNAWVLRLDWHTASKGPYPIFCVEMPEDVEGWLKRETSFPPATRYTADLCLAAKRLLGKGTMLNRQPFAGFPAFGLRFLGCAWTCGRHCWRFSYGVSRTNSMAARYANKVDWVMKKKWAEDVYPGGYLNLFYPPGTLFSWAGWEWVPAARRPTMGELFAASRAEG